MASEKAYLYTLVNNEELSNTHFIIKYDFASEYKQDDSLDDSKDKLIWANREILAHWSPVFKAMLYGAMKESINKKEAIIITDISYKTFYNMIVYM